MFMISAITILLFTIAGWWALKRYRRMHILQRLGYSVPPGNFIGGNLLELITTNDLDAQIEWMNKYAQDMPQKGKILGWYRGPVPMIFTTNPEFLKEVFIKDSENFIDRPMIDRSDNIPHLLLLRGSQWKRVRSTLSPTFSASKMRRMSAVVSDAADILVKVVGMAAEKGEEVNIYDMYQGLTLDVIGQCGLALKVNCQLDQQDKLLVMVRKTLKHQIDLTAVVAAFFPEVEMLMATMFRGGRKKTNDIILSWIKEVLDRRRALANKGIQDGETPIDSLQLMMDAAEGKNGENRILTDDEIIANAFAFILAGYETTATGLSFTTHLLAHYPEAQEKLFEEIDSIMDDEILNPKVKDSDWAEKFDEKIHQLHYLEMVINEGLRLYGPIPNFFGRWAEQDREVMGYKIPKGSAILAPLWYMHHDPNVWPDPWKFDPERFSAENKSKIPDMAYLPFGVGPRKCIGMRFAMMETKIALINLIKNFRLEPSLRTPLKAPCRNKGFTLAPKNEEIFVKPIRR